MKPRIYNLFPLVCRNFDDLVEKSLWARSLNFDWIYLNPIHPVGMSGSLYSVLEHTKISSRWFPKEWDSFHEYCHIAEDNGLKIMVDLVASHSAVDSSLLQSSPGFFLWNNERVVNPGCKEADGSWTSWGDLAKHNWYKDNEALIRYFSYVIDMFIYNGASGFRCDAAYQVPSDCWRELLRQRRAAQFFAETLGCTNQQAIDTWRAGFDYGFNSVCWWNGNENWFHQQKNEFGNAGMKVIGFPESHDTNRVSAYSESKGRNVLEEQWKRYEMAFHNSDGILMPVGYEFMERRKLHVVDTMPKDVCMIETPASKILCDRIRGLNGSV